VHPGAASRRPGPSKILYSPNWLIGVSPGDSGLDFFGGGPEYFKIIPLTWQDNEFIPVLMAKPAEWPAPGFTDTELGVLMEPEVNHGEAEVYARVQA
jgi:hypothetical protein